MSEIPQSVWAVSRLPRDVQDLLIAAILRSEDEQLIVSHEELRIAGQYALVTTVINDEGLVLSIRPRR